MRKWRRYILVVLCISVLVLPGCSGLMFELGQDNPGVTVTIAVMRDSSVEDFNTNYYTKWLEEKSGYNIEFVYFTQGYEKEYLVSMLEPDRGTVDGVFLPENNEILSDEEFFSLADRGLVSNISELADESSNVAQIVSISDKDTPLYYMPRLKNGKKDTNARILWINMGWLKKLDLKIPETYEELEEVLLAFSTKDPNGNGVADEIPLITNNSKPSLCSEDLLKLAYSHDEKKGNEYCDGLKEKGLLSDTGRDFTVKQLQEMVNSPRDYIGAFTSQSITEVIYPYCAEIIARYTFVTPLIDGNGQRHADSVTSPMRIGGYIPGNAVHKREAFEIMDIMLSEEASLVAVYGEKDVDYRESAEAELSAYGNRARITTINYLRFSLQNKNYAGAGPINLPSEYTDEVKWNGDNTYAEYMDARAVRLYEQYYK